MFKFCKQKQTPNDYAAALKKRLPAIESIILYGSAATGDFLSKGSDYNLLVIGPAWGVLELNQVAKLSKDWIAQGNTPPLLFTMERLKASADCFPIEMIDMKKAYKVISGNDVLADVEVDPKNLRLMVERELKSLKIQLRQGFLYAGGNPRKVADLIVNSLSTTLVLFRAALRLHEGKTPNNKYEVLSALRVFVPTLEEEAFLSVRKLKNKELSPAKANSLNLFDRVLSSIVAVADNIDTLQA